MVGTPADADLNSKTAASSVSFLSSSDTHALGGGVTGAPSRSPIVEVMEQGPVTTNSFASSGGGSASQLHQVDLAQLTGDAAAQSSLPPRAVGGKRRSTAATAGASSGASSGSSSGSGKRPKQQHGAVGHLVARPVASDGASTMTDPDSHDRSGASSGMQSVMAVGSRCAVQLVSVE